MFFKRRYSFGSHGRSVVKRTLGHGLLILDSNQKQFINHIIGSSNTCPFHFVLNYINQQLVAKFVFNFRLRDRKFCGVLERPRIKWSVTRRLVYFSSELLLPASAVEQAAVKTPSVKYSSPCNFNNHNSFYAVRNKKVENLLTDMKKQLDELQRQVEVLTRQKSTKSRPWLENLQQYCVNSNSFAIVHAKYAFFSKMLLQS